MIGSIIKYAIGLILVMTYSYLKFNVDGYWFAIPFLILCLILQDWAFRDIGAKSTEEEKDV